MRAFLAAFRLQVQVIRSDPDYVMPLVTVPLFTIVFLAIVEHAGRSDLTGYAVLAPVLIALWALSLYVSGEIVDSDRAQGVLESTVAAPAPFAVVLLARVLAVTTVALLAVPEVWLVARLLFDVTIEINHPAAFAATLALTVLATSGAGVIMASVFVVARSVRNFQNSLTYPVYVLAGVFVPISVLPDWLEPLSHAIFLSWSADLLRDALAADAIAHLVPRLAAIVALALANFAVGYVALARMLHRVRVSGALGHT
jgi:ABC-2 type transport system permease protein